MNRIKNELMFVSASCLRKGYVKGIGDVTMVSPMALLEMRIVESYFWLGGPKGLRSSAGMLFRQLIEVGLWM